MQWSIIGSVGVLIAGWPLGLAMLFWRGDASASPIPVTLAQTPALDERFIQPAPVPTPLPADEDELQPVAPPVEPEPATPAATVAVEKIEVLGSSIFDESDFAPIVQPVEGQTVTLVELQQVAAAITQLYLDRGYITSRAILVDQVIEAGLVQIRVIEGSVEAIQVEGNERLNAAYIRDRIALGAETPLNQAQLEDQLRLLRLDPRFENVEASLRAGTGLGQSILLVRVTEAEALFAELSVDNYSPPEVGAVRTGVLAGVRNITGLGDTLSASYYRSTPGASNAFDFNYRLPLNAMDGTLQLRFAPSNFRLIEQDGIADLFDIEGESELYEVSVRQPLVRSPQEEFAVSLGLSHRDGTIFVDEQQLFDPTSTSVIQFGQDYTHRDRAGAWALRSQFNLGTALLDATTSGEPDGQFLNWLGQVQRVHILSPDNLLIVQGDVQLSADPLLSSQQFVIGGGQSLRGYRQNVRRGDNGIRLSVEDRVALARDEAGTPTLQIAPFADLGWVWNDGENSDLPDDSFLAGIGVGVLWVPVQDWTVRLDVALPLVDLSDRGDNAQDDGLYFSVVYRP